MAQCKSVSFGGSLPGWRQPDGRICRRHRALGALLSSSILASGAMLAPAHAVPCTGAANGPNSTSCINGATLATLTYPTPGNPAYMTGDFTLLLNNHDVIVAAGRGIDFTDPASGNGIIILENDSFVASAAGFNGINSSIVDGNTTIKVLDTSSVAGNASGIAAQSTRGDIVINSDAGAVITGATGDGISAVVTDSGNVSVTALGIMTGLGNGGGDGVEASAAQGTVEVTTGAGAVSGFRSGINALATLNTVKVTTGAGGVSATSGSGIVASGATGTTVDAHGDVSGKIDGISAESVTGLVKVTTAAGTAVEGTDRDGIEAEATTSGNVDVTANSSVTGGDNGIDADAISGAVKVATGTAAVIAHGGNGINATASGLVTVDTKGDVSGTNAGINAQSSAGGNIAVTTLGGASASVTGAGSAGIAAGTTGAGTVTITNNADVRGSVAGITATSGGGAIHITNDFFIANTSLDDSGLAIQTTGGPATIDNNFGLGGRVITGTGADVLNNKFGWITEGISDFGGGGDTINNDGMIGAGDDAGLAETTTFTNLEILNNNAAGIIDLQDQATGDGSNISDRFATSGNYKGGGGLEVDAFLGGAGSVADVLAVGGSTTGVTQIFVNDTNAGPGVFNPTGILVVDVGGTGTAADFVLANGPIDKGMFFYDLLFDAGAGEHRLVGLPDREVFETLAAVASSQEIWRESADAWSTRQENLRDVMAGRQVVTGVADPAVVGDDAPMGSLWMSALGSWAERDGEASFSLMDGSFDFDTSYSQDIYGVVAGADFRADMGGETSMLFGVMAGYVDSKLSFDESSTSIDSKGGTLGAYAALMSGGFFTAVLIKADLLTLDYTVGSLAADDSDSADVTSWGARGDLGYRFGVTLFVEPMLSVDAMSTKIDGFSVGGADIDAGTNESFRAGAGLRVGYGGETARASATARLWDVFSTDNEVDVLAGVPLGLSDDDLEGVYGDVSGQIDVTLSASVTAYLKGGILFSDDVTKPNASGGFAFTW